MNPTVETLLSDDAMASAGTLEIIPLEQPLTLFVWSSSRVVPVRLTDFSITEEAFDPNLNPIRAKVSLGMRVLNVDDLGFEHPGGRMFMTYLTNKESLAEHGEIGGDHHTRPGRSAMNYPLQAMAAAGRDSARHLPHRQPLLRLRRAAVHRAQRPGDPYLAAAHCAAARRAELRHHQPVHGAARRPSRPHRRASISAIR